MLEKMIETAKKFQENFSSTRQPKFLIPKKEYSQDESASPAQTNQQNIQTESDEDSSNQEPQNNKNNDPYKNLF